MTRKRDTRTNRLLAALPAADRARLSTHLDSERMELKQLVFEPGKHIDCVYFPGTAVISVLRTMDDGSGVELATIGNEGMVGVALFFGASSMPVREFSQVQVPGEVLRMDTRTFREETAVGGALHSTASCSAMSRPTSARCPSRWPATACTRSRNAAAAGCS